jgi:hypothetical protein
MYGLDIYQAKLDFMAYTSYNAEKKIKVMVIILIALIALKVGTMPLKSKDEPLKPFKFELIISNLMKKLFRRK